MNIEKQYWLLPIGLAVLFIPSYVTLYNKVWTNSDEMHGPIVLAVAVWALWKVRSNLARMARQGTAVGWLVLCLGLAAYFVGRTLEILVLEIGSQLLVLSACLLLLGGWRAIRIAAFPLAFILFLIPLPGNFVDAMTGALKQVVSTIAENVLYWAGYPIARSGVIISVGPYQLMVADACSGLKSMFSLSAMGLLYVYLQGHKSPWRNGFLISLLLPIAFVANVVRVIVLILVTYHFGDAAGQGFVHDASGIVLFIIAILCLGACDIAIGRSLKFKGAVISASH
jgi:exosortase B